MTEQRKMFEAWWQDEIKRNSDAPIGADYRHWANLAWQACLAAQPAPQRVAVPEGWQLVPKVPTDAMLQTLADSEGDVIAEYLAFGTSVWEDMLSAAPKPDAGWDGKYIPEEWRTMLANLARGLDLMTKLAAERVSFPDEVFSRAWVKEARALLAKGV